MSSSSSKGGGGETGPDLKAPGFAILSKRGDGMMVDTGAAAAARGTEDCDNWNRISAASVKGKRKRRARRSCEMMQYTHVATAT